jgi:hypothetical protein
MEKVRRFSKPIRCPNVAFMSYSAYGYVKVGSLIYYRESEDRTRVARVLGFVTRDGAGKEYKPRTLLGVLAANDTLTHGYFRLVAIEEVLDVRCEAEEARTFGSWFLNGDVVNTKTAVIVDFIEYGAMCDSYLAKYINPDGTLRARRDRRG